MAVGADQRIGVSHLDAILVGAGPYGLGDIFEIDLVADAGARRDDLEIVEALAAPFEEFVALGIALIFEFDVGLERLGGAEFVDHHAVVDDEMDRHLRVDLLRVAAERLHRVAHCGEVDHRGDAGEILHQHARRAILDLAVDRPFLEPVGHRLEIVAGDRHPILEAQEVFEQHLHRERQPRHVAERRRRLGQRIISVSLAAGLERRAGVQTVVAGGDHHGPHVLGRGPCGPRNCARPSNFTRR